ncbi:MAG: class I SAM-dependent methyltransferase [Chloroflexi bacterium]|nr:MAG: class I SAM-dependent methyltransferase [Chloroflexota bacterium]
MTVTPRRPSRTAVLTAVARALHREEPPPWVLDDPLAMGLAGEDGAEVAKRFRTELSTETLLSFTRWVCVRARLPEDIVETAFANGLRQYVILGAGLDSFAYRRTDLLTELRVFEVDHPASQAWKRQRLKEMGVRPPPNLTYAPIDFEHQTLRRGLATAGFDFAAPAVFSWIGVTMYLTVEAIRATLATIATCAPGTRLVLTYNQPLSALHGIGLELDKAIRAFATEAGEPFLSLFVPKEIEALLTEMGFAEIMHFGPDEAIRTYFAGRSDVRFGGAQRLIVATVLTRET